MVAFRSPRKVDSDEAVVAIDSNRSPTASGPAAKPVSTEVRMRLTLSMLTWAVRAPAWDTIASSSAARRVRSRGMTEPGASLDRKSVVEGKSVLVRVDLGGRRIIKK